MSSAPRAALNLERFNNYEKLCLTETVKITNSMRDLDTFLGSTLARNLTNSPGKLTNLRLVVQDVRRILLVHLSAAFPSCVVVLRVPPKALAALEQGKHIVRSATERSLDEILAGGEALESPATARSRYAIHRSFGLPVVVGAPGAFASPFAPQTQTIGAGNKAPATFGSSPVPVKYSSPRSPAQTRFNVPVESSAAKLDSATPVSNSFVAPLPRSTGTLGNRPTPSIADSKKFGASKSSSTMAASPGGFGAPSPAETPPKPVAPTRTADKGANNGSDGARKKTAPAKQSAAAKNHGRSAASSANKSFDKPVKTDSDGTTLKTSAARTTAAGMNGSATTPTNTKSAKTASSSSEKKKALIAKSTLPAKTASSNKSTITKTKGYDASPVPSPISSGKTASAGSKKMKTPLSKTIQAPKKPSSEKKATPAKNPVSTNKPAQVEKFVYVPKSAPKSTASQKPKAGNLGAGFNPFGLKQPKNRVPKFSSLGDSPGVTNGMSILKGIGSATKDASTAKTSPAIENLAATNTYGGTANIDSLDDAGSTTHPVENASDDNDMAFPAYRDVTPMSHISTSRASQMDSSPIETNYNRLRQMDTTFAPMASSPAMTPHGGTAPSTKSCYTPTGSSQMPYQMNASTSVAPSVSSPTIGPATSIHTSPDGHPQLGSIAPVVESPAMRAPQGLHTRQATTSSTARTKSRAVSTATLSPPKSPRNEPAKKKLKTLTASRSLSRQSLSLSPPRKQKKQLKERTPREFLLSPPPRRCSTAASSTIEPDTRTKPAAAAGPPKLKKRVNTLTFAAKRRAAKEGRSAAVTWNFDPSGDNITGGDDHPLEVEDNDNASEGGHGDGGAAAKAELARALFDDDF